MLGKSDTWSMSRLPHRTSEPVYYIEDCQISSTRAESTYYHFFPISEFPYMLIRFLFHSSLVKLAYMATSGGHFSRALGMGGYRSYSDDKYLKWQ